MSRSVIAVAVAVAVLAVPIAALAETARRGSVDAGLAANRHEIAVRAFANGRFDEAAKLLREARTADPASDEIVDSLVRALVHAGRGEEAVREAQAALDAEPTSALRWTFLGDAYVGAARFEEAQIAYSGALEIRETARAHVGLGWLEDSVANRKTARRHYAEAYRLDPGDPEVLSAWAIRVAEGAQAREALQRLVSIEGRWTKLELEAMERNLAAWEFYDKLERPELVTDESALPLAFPLRGMDPPGRAMYPDPRATIELSTGERRSARVLLDTGGSGLLVKSSVARRLGATAFAEARAFGFGGDDSVRIRHANLARARIGAGEIRNAVVSVGNSAGAMSDIDGIIGTDVFSRYLVELDLGGETLRIHPLPARDGVGPDTDWDELDRPEASIPPDAAKSRFAGTHIFVEAGFGSKKEGWLLVDSGGIQNLLDLSVAESLGKTSSSPVTLVGLGGTKEARLAPSFMLKVGALRQENRDIPAVPLEELSGQMGFRISGILGPPFLRQVVLWINYRDGWVRMVPRATPAKPPTP